MPSPINKQSLEHLARLARIELDSREEEKLAKDLSSILDHFEELQSINTSGVEQMTGGTTLTNAFREDGERENTDREAGAHAFLKTKNGFLQIPPVFDSE